jgi:hypothetical protein
MMRQYYGDAYDLGYQLPKPLAQLLMAMVETAERDEVLTAFCSSCQSAEESGAFDLSVGARAEPTVVKRLRGNPIASLQQLGFVERLSQNNVFLYPAAFAWAKYERKGQFGKWLTRAYNRGRDVVLVVVSTLTVLLTILRIVELVQ